MNEGSEILIEIDEKKALKYYFLSAELGNTDSMKTLGECYAAGELVEKNFKKSLFWFQRAINEYDLNALAHVADMYYKGEHFEQNFSEALKWYKKGAELNYHYCMGQLGMMYSRGEGVQQSEKKAEEFLLNALKDPCVRNCNEFEAELAKIYLLRAQKLFAYWAIRTSGSIQEEDGTISEIITPINTPLNQMKLHIALAAFHYGDKSAADNLGYFGEEYYVYSDNEADKKQGLEWMINAAKNNFPQHLTVVAKKLKNKNQFDEAIKLFKIAADSGDGEAVNGLIGIYSEINDIENLFKWCKKFAELGNSYSLQRFTFGVMFGSSKFKQDLKLAHEGLEKIIETGHKKANWSFADSTEDFFRNCLNKADEADDVAVKKLLNELTVKAEATGFKILD